MLFGVVLISSGTCCTLGHVQRIARPERSRLPVDLHRQLSSRNGKIFDLMRMVMSGRFGAARPERSVHLEQLTSRVAARANEPERLSGPGVADRFVSHVRRGLLTQRSPVARPASIRNWMKRKIGPPNRPPVKQQPAAARISHAPPYW